MYTVPNLVAAEKAKLGYPPSGSITDQRANRAGEVRFYCAIGKGLAVLEKAVDGDLIAISKWKIVRKFYINDVRHNRPSVFNQSSVDKVIGKFFATEFGQKINEGKEHLYKLSIAISESLAGANQTIEDLNGVFGWGGLIYPSIHTGGDNLVLFPEVVDSCLELVNVEYVRVDKIESPKVTITHLDFSNTFNDGLIEWKGRVCKLEIESGSEVSVSYGDNGAVLKDSFGNTLEPV